MINSTNFVRETIRKSFKFLKFILLWTANLKTCYITHRTQGTRNKKRPSHTSNNLHTGRKTDKCMNERERKERSKHSSLSFTRKWFTENDSCLFCFTSSLVILSMYSEISKNLISLLSPNFKSSKDEPSLILHILPFPNFSPWSKCS